MSTPTAVPCDGRTAPEATLGILAGGRGSRLGGMDKAWLLRDGTPQVLRLHARLRGGTRAALVSANRDIARYEAAGLRVVRDRHADLGPIGGLDALAHACTTAWLFTVPVDLGDADRTLLGRLAAAGGQGAWVEDGGGVQPLVALWHVPALRAAAADCIAAGTLAVQALQRRLGMRAVRLDGVTLGNLNTAADLRAWGMQPQ